MDLIDHVASRSGLWATLQWALIFTAFSGHPFSQDNRSNCSALIFHLPLLIYLPVGNSCLSLLSGGMSTLSGDRPSSLEFMACIVAGF